MKRPSRHKKIKNSLQASSTTNSWKEGRYEELTALHPKTVLAWGKGCQMCNNTVALQLLRWTGNDNDLSEKHFFCSRFCVEKFKEEECT